MHRLVLLLLVFAVACVTRAADPEADEYNEAAKAFNDRFFERAQQQFAQFAQKFPNSPQRVRALLLQSQALFFQKQYDAALKVIDGTVASSGDLADEFLFWRGQALLEKGDFPGAAAAFGKLLADFPASSRALAAATAQAASHFRNKEFERTVQLLSDANASFRQLAGGSLTNTNAFQGQILLGESLLTLNRIDEARTAVSLLSTNAELPQLAWEREVLLARIELAGPKPEEGLAPVNRAAAIAAAANRPGLSARALNLEAEIYRKLNQTENLVAAYDKIARTETISVDERRLALLKAVELLAGQQQLAGAIQRLEGHLSQNAQDPSADLLRVKVAELWLDQFRALKPGEQRAAATNALSQARIHLNTVVNELTNSPHLGKAWLDLGWVGWEEGTALNDPARIRESQTAFQTAINTLTRSDDQALARFKLGDAAFYLKDYATALTNYTFLVANYADLPQATTALFDKAYQQLVRTAIELNNLPDAGKHAAEMRRLFPNNARTEETIFLYGKALALAGKPAEARAAFEDFLKNYPQSHLSASVHFALARTYEAEGNWSAAIARHEQWLGQHTNSPLRPAVEFQRAWTWDQAGNRTNALALFSNFVTAHVQSPLAPAAQNWIADYYYDQEQWILAEQNYQQLFQNTNWQGSSLFYPARLMAARTAFRRQGYAEARSYLTNLIADVNCPENIKPEAWFALGDVILEQPIIGSTNQLNNFREAANVFELITKRYASNRVAPMAWGKLGNCHLQLASEYPQSYTNALAAYQRALDLAGFETPVAVLNQAEIGLALTNEKIAETKPPAERQDHFKRALEHYLNVVYGTKLEGRKSDPRFLRSAAVSAGRLAELLGDADAALSLYKRLLTELPSMQSVWETRISALQKKLASR